MPVCPSRLSQVCMSLQRCAVALCVAGALIFGVGAANAQAFSWKLPVSGSWNDPSSWLGGAGSQLFPNSATADVAVSVLGAPYTIRLNASVSVASLNMDADMATLELSSGRQFTTSGPITISSGTINFDGAFLGLGTPTMLDIESSGRAWVSANTTLPAATPVRLNAGGFLDIAGATLSAANAAGFTNNGTLRLYGSTPAWLFMQAPLLNAGYFDVFSSPAGVVHTLSAPLTNLPTGQVSIGQSLNVFSGNTVNQGAFTVLPGAVYNLAGRAFTQQDGLLTVDGEIRAGTFNLNGGRVRGQLVIANHGTVPTFNYNGGLAEGAPIIDGGSGGAIFNNRSALDTQSFVMKGLVTMNFGVNPGQQITLETSGGGHTTATVLGTYINHGVVNLQAPDGYRGVATLLPGPGASFRNGFGGQLVGSGNLGSVSSPLGVFVSEGSIVPRAGTQYDRGIINVVADTTRLLPSSVINVTLDAFAPGLGFIDRLNITGAAELAGTVELNIGEGLNFSVGDHWTLLTVTSYTGAFSGMNVVAAPPGVLFGLDYLTYGVNVVVVAVPEPTTCLMWLAGAAGLLAWRRPCARVRRRTQGLSPGRSLPFLTRR